MADLSKITLPSGTTYNIKDAQAREDIAAIQQSITSGVTFAGNTTTVLTDGATTNPITINGSSYTAKAGDLVTYGDSEFLWDGSKWVFFGDFGSLGDLAFKDSASGSYEPEGTVSKPTFTGTEKTVTVSGTATGSVSISVGTGTANYTPAGTVSKPTFTGSEGNVSVSGTATGSVSAPTITVTPNTATVNSITDVGTLPSWTGTVTGEKLTISWSTGTLPTKGSNQTVVTGIKSATSSQPSFTGSAFTSTGKFTPAGSVSQPTFTGTGKELKAAFTGSSFNSTGKFTPEGSVSQPTFDGTSKTVTVS